MSTLAIDQGTTSTRAVNVNSAGASTLVHSIFHQQFYPEPGRVEHDAEELLANVIACIDVGVKAGQGVADAVQVLGIDNQGESCLAWHAETGEPLGPVIVWQDDRTRGWIEQLESDGVGPEVMRRAGLPLDPYFSASKLGWIMRHVPLAASLAARGKLRLGTTDAFFRDRLTGRHETDVTTASRTSLMNLSRCQWDEELCRLFGVPMEALPHIGASNGALGTVKSANGAMPLGASLVDQQAALYGHGCRQAGDAKMTFGTGAFALVVTGTQLHQIEAGPLPTVAWQKSGEPAQYALDGGVYAAASAVNWARELGLFQQFDEINSFSTRTAIERELVFLPALAGLACPHWDRRARGCFMGLSLDTRAADLMQAVLEGVACRMVEVIRSMAQRQTVSTPVSIDGGMAANPYFTQFLANVLEHELLVLSGAERTALGTAALAAESIGQPFGIQRAGRLVTPTEGSGGLMARFELALGAAQLYAAASLSS